MMTMQLAIVALSFLIASAPRQRSPGPANPNSVSALVGNWQVNLARTHYGPGVDRRRSEGMVCTQQVQRIQCVIRSIRSDGRELTGRFSAALDGHTSPVTGIPDIDQVELTQNGSLTDATFFSRGRPAFGYRAMQSADGRSLMIVSVDPVTRMTGTTIVVYDRR